MWRSAWKKRETLGLTFLETLEHCESNVGELTDFGTPQSVSKNGASQTMGNGPEDVTQVARTRGWTGLIIRYRKCKSELVRLGISEPTEGQIYERGLDELEIECSGLTETFNDYSEARCR
jgi:hypothetical protein